MSHFVVLVVGDNIDHQLEEFDENIEVEQYEQELLSEDDKEQFMDYYKSKSDLIKDESHRDLGFEALYAIYGYSWNSGRWAKNDDGEWAEFSTYNPLSKWDWYSVGGRWSDHLLLKNGNYADQAKKGDIDFIGMRMLAQENAIKQYQKVKGLFGGEIPKIEKSWKEFLDDKSMDIDEKRAAYHEQPALLRAAEVRKDNDLGFFFDLSNYACTEEEYSKEAYNGGIGAYAAVKDCRWYEQGQMGWFGTSSNDKEEVEWSNELDAIIADCGDDEIITIVDCHI
jgi:hypothetical protein